MTMLMMIMKHRMILILIIRLIISVTLDGGSSFNSPDSKISLMLWFKRKLTWNLGEKLLLFVAVQVLGKQLLASFSFSLNPIWNIFL